jgi:hypothetical protein
MSKNILLFITIIAFIIVIKNYSKFPSRETHIYRNNYNVPPKGHLTFIKDNKYIDGAGIIWYKRNFMQSLLHNPFMYYVFETYDELTTHSSEVVVLKTDFDSGNQIFKPASFNFYSSFRFPVSHLFADVLPIFIYKWI